MPSHFAGAPLPFWIGFHAIVGVLLLVDLLILGRAKTAGAGVRQAWAWTAFLAAAAFCFALFLSHDQGRGHAVEFVSGYLVEGSLSVDNLFVFLLLFRSLGLDENGQRQVLLWGVLGAIVLRAVCIFAGVALLTRFAWVQYIFGAILLYAGIRLLRPEHDGEDPDDQPAPLRWLRKRLGSSAPGKLHGSAFFLVVVTVELTDLIFALDSIPAVFAITRDPFIVYTSNIFAILGLRSLYFGLKNVLDKLRLLHYGLAVILIFVAGKMLAARWVEVSAGVSLAVILAILIVFAVASKLLPAPPKTAA